MAIALLPGAFAVATACAEAAAIDRGGYGQTASVATRGDDHGHRGRDGYGKSLPTGHRTDADTVGFVSGNAQADTDDATSRAGRRPAQATPGSARTELAKARIEAGHHPFAPRAQAPPART